MIKRSIIFSQDSSIKSFVLSVFLTSAVSHCIAENAIAVPVGWLPIRIIPNPIPSSPSPWSTTKVVVLVVRRTGGLVDPLATN